MKNKFVKIFFSLMLSVAAILLISSCGEEEVTPQPDGGAHKHTFASEWKNDTVGHWHPATCGHNDEKGDYAEHFGLAPDCVCDACGYVSHSFGEEWVYNEDGHWHIADCGKSDHYAGREKHTDEDKNCMCDVCGGFMGHKGEWITVTDPTCTEQGLKERVCTDCGKTETSEIAKIAHTKSEPVIENEIPATCDVDGSKESVVYCLECGEELSRETIVIPSVGHTYSEEWLFDNEKHWKECSCKHKSDVSAHEVGENGVCTVCAYAPHEHTPATDAVIENAKDPTCTEAGSYELVVYCTQCSYEFSRETMVGDEKTGHKEAAPVIENEVPSTCETDGTYESVVYCKKCGEELSRDYITTEAGHSYSDEWSTDGQKHWHAAVCAHSSEVKDEGEHVGMEDCICDVCGYANHGFDTTWRHNEDGHWHIADCGNVNHKSEIAPHIGMEDCKCDVCGYFEHSFADEWMWDETHHWHDSTCTHKNEKDEYEGHNLVAGKCSDCGYVDPTKAPVELPMIPA